MKAYTAAVAAALLGASAISAFAPTLSGVARVSNAAATQSTALAMADDVFDQEAYIAESNRTTNPISTMKSVIFASALASAAAFAPAQTGKASTALNAFESELGAQPPLGFYDPLGMLDDADQERFDRLRYVEIKHGRISQLAFLGQITTRAGFHLSGDIDTAGNSFDSFPNGFAAIGGPDSIPGAGTGQIIAFIGLLELFVMKDSANGAAPGDFVGDFRNGYIDFGWDSFDEETKLQKRAVELNQGRAAMMGILGLMVHEQLGGSVPIVGEL